MSDEIIIFFLSVGIVILTVVILYQRFAFRSGIQKELNIICKKLTQILNENSDEKIMVFTNHYILMNLSAQINRLLEESQKVKANYRHSEISSKKMLSNVSHDIKTPLTVILGYLEIMRMSDKENEMLKKVENKAEQVMELINQFFTLAKLEAGDTEIEVVKLNVNEICRESILDFYDILIQKNIQVEVSIPESDIFILGNKDALRRILYNLLSNAVRYGLEGKYLGLSIRMDDAFAYIDVTDKGKGIDKKFAESVFERLFTMEDSRNREMQGNGLGLSISRNLAAQLNGTITLASEPFVETTFTVKLDRIFF